MALGYSSIFDLMRRAVNSPERTAVDDIGNESSFTDGFRTYNSMGELLETENINILFPTRLPDGYEFTNFVVIESGGNFRIQASATEPYIFFIARIRANIEIVDFSYEVGGIRYNILELGDGVYQGEWIIGADYYEVVVDDDSVISEIIKKLGKGVKNA